MPSPHHLELGRCEVDLTSGRVSSASGTSFLPEPERRLLQALAASCGEVVPRDQLVRALGGSALDGVLHRLRARVEPDPAHPAVLLTEHGDGVRLVAGPQVVWLADGVADVGARWVRRGPIGHELTSREAALLAYLAARPGVVVPRDELLTRVWRVRALATRALETTLWRLRKKVEVDPARPRHLVTVRGGGTRFDPVSRAEATAGAPSGFVADRHAEWVLERVRGGQGAPPAELAAAARHHLDRGDRDAALTLFRPLREAWWADARHDEIVALAGALLEGPLDPVAQAELRWIRAGSYSWAGRWAEAMADVEAGLAVAPPAAPIAASLLLDGASVAHALGQPERAREMLDRAGAQVDPGDALQAARVAEARGRDALNRSDPLGARDLAIEGLTALETAARLGAVDAEAERFLHRRGELLTTLGLAHRELGRAEIACANFREATGVISRTRAADHLRWARLHWAAAVADLGRHDEAEARFAELLEGTHAPEDEALVRFDRGAARAIAGRLDDARADLERALDLGTVLHRAVAGQVALALAAVLARMDAPDRAEALIHEACAALPEEELAYLGLREVALGCVAVARGARDQARAHLARARGMTPRPYPQVLDDALQAAEDLVTLP